MDIVHNIISLLFVLEAQVLHSFTSLIEFLDNYKFLVFVFYLPQSSILDFVVPIISPATYTQYAWDSFPLSFLCSPSQASGEMLQFYFLYGLFLSSLLSCQTVIVRIDVYESFRSLVDEFACVLDAKITTFDKIPAICSTCAFRTGIHAYIYCRTRL